MLGQLLCEYLATPVSEDSSLTVSLGGAREIGKIAPPDRRELECGPFGSTQARRASSDWTTPRAGLGERAERSAGSCSCHASGGMGLCVGRDGDQVALPSLGPFLCNRRTSLESLRFVMFFETLLINFAKNLCKRARRCTSRSSARQPADGQVFLTNSYAHRASKASGLQRPQLDPRLPCKYATYSLVTI